MIGLLAELVGRVMSLDERVGITYLVLGDYFPGLTEDKLKRFFDRTSTILKEIGVK